MSWYFRNTGLVDLFLNLEVRAVYRSYLIFSLFCIAILISHSTQSVWNMSYQNCHADLHHYTQSNIHHHIVSVEISLSFVSCIYTYVISIYWWQWSFQFLMRFVWLVLLSGCIYPVILAHRLCEVCENISLTLPTSLYIPDLWLEALHPWDDAP